MRKQIFPANWGWGCCTRFSKILKFDVSGKESRCFKYISSHKGVSQLPSRSQSNSCNFCWSFSLRRLPQRMSLRLVLSFYTVLHWLTAWSIREVLTLSLVTMGSVMSASFFGGWTSFWFSLLLSVIYTLEYYQFSINKLHFVLFSMKSSDFWKVE